jgi:DNA-binding transcriptional ArsR family regulator
MKPTSPKAADAKAPRSLAGSRSMSTVEGGGRTVDWDALAPRVKHPTRRAIVEAIEEVGEPMTASDLHTHIGDTQCARFCVTYHANILVNEDVLRVAGVLVSPGAEQPLYFFP